jgi:hypothetical protein
MKILWIGRQKSGEGERLREKVERSLVTKRLKSQEVE